MDEKKDYGHQGTGAAGTAPATGFKVVQNIEDGDVRIGFWPLPPVGYKLLTTKEEILEALTVFNVTDLRDKIADLYFGKF